jgi:hypothetical protein
VQQRLRLVRIAGGALLVGVVVAALGRIGWKLYTQPWFWFWVVAIVAAAGVLALALTSDARNRNRENPRATIQNVLIGGGLLLALSAGFFGIAVDPTLDKAGTVQSATLVALGLMAVGIVVGFLFGLPKISDASTQAGTSIVTAPTPQNPSSSSQGPTTAATTIAQGGNPVRLRPNTNLEKVSDWLTTVITGLVLTQLSQVPTYIGQLSGYLSGGLDGAAAPAATNPHDPLTVTSLGIILHFPLTGFLIGYITTRLVLTHAFDVADRSLFSADDKSKVDIRPSLLEADLGEFGGKQPSPGDRDVAQRIIATDASTLLMADEKATYARAQAVLGNYAVAIPWYQAALVLDPQNPKLLEQYAAALYAQDNIDAFQMIPPLEKALGLSQGDTTAYPRIATNLALAYLYVRPDGYLRSLKVANDLIGDPKLDKRPAIFFYRACAYGQLYTDVRSGRSFGPDEVETIDVDEIGHRIIADTRKALDMQPSLLPNFNLVARNSSTSRENDLVAYATDHPECLDLLDSYDPTVASRAVVTVTHQPPAKLVIGLSSDTVATGSDVTLTATFIGSSDEITVSSSNQTVVTVDPIAKKGPGPVTFVARGLAAGRATLTVKSGTELQTVELSVVA